MRTSSIAVFAAATLSLLVTACSSPSANSANSPATSAASGSASGPAKSPADPLAAMSANEAAGKAVADLKATSSVHVSGSLADSGTTIVLNLTAGTTSCAGTMSVPGTGAFQIINIGNTVWMKPDNQFWKTSAGNDPAVLSLLEGKYLKTTMADKNLNSLAQFCRPTMLGALFDGPTGLVKGQTTVISGEPALQLRDGGDSGSFEVSDSAMPELLRLYSGKNEQLEFTAYGVPPSVTVPPASETLSGAKYGL
jgi:hypothetical protein